MKSKGTDILWAVCLFVIGIATVVLAGSNLFGVELPDTAVRILGLIDLAALPALAFSTVKKLKSRE